MQDHGVAGLNELFVAPNSKDVSPGPHNATRNIGLDERVVEAESGASSLRTTGHMGPDTRVLASGLSPSGPI